MEVTSNVNIHIRLAKNVHKRFRRICSFYGISMKEMCGNLIKEFLLINEQAKESMRENDKANKKKEAKKTYTFEEIQNAIVNLWK